MERKPPTGFVLGGLVALYLGLPTVTVAQGLTVSGYADFEAVVNSVDADDNDFFLRQPPLQPDHGRLPRG